MEKGTIRLIGRRLRSFAGGTQGALLTEALIVVPVVTIFAVGILEFGNVFWQRHQVQVAVRDAARYWARCRQDDVFTTCTDRIARDLAFYGNPLGEGPPRIVGWVNDDALKFEPEVPPSNPDANDIVRVTGTHTYTGSPLMRLLQIEAFDFSYTHEQRYIGW
jgi:hypothetical protein